VSSAHQFYICINSWPRIAIAPNTSMAARDPEGTLTPQKSPAVIRKLPLA